MKRERDGVMERHKDGEIMEKGGESKTLR